MKQILFILIFINFLYAQNKDILLLHSYHKGYKWSDDISKVIEEKLNENKNINLTTIYMDTKRVSNDTYYEHLAKLYEEQFKNRRFDLIIASDNNALEFLRREKDEIFPNIPILFCGINNFQYELLKGFEKITGVVEQVDLRKNFSLIKKLHPNLKTLYIVNDDSNTGLEMKKNLEPIMEEYSKFFKIDYIENTKMEDIEDEIKEIDDNSVILFVLLHKDKVGNRFTYKESLKKIRDASSIPIYGLWDFYLNYGIVGGLLTSAEEQGNAVASMALKIVNGENIKEIPVLEKSPNRYIFDYNELDRFDIDVSSILSNYQLINEPHGFIRKYKKLVVTTITIILVLIIMILAMRANIQRRKVVEKDLQNRIKFDKVLLDTLPNPIYYKNKDGKFLGCNRAFSELLNIPKKEVIGKTAKDFFSPEIAKRNEDVDKKLLSTFGTDTSEVTLHLSNNHMKHIIINKAVYLNNDGSIGGIVCIMDDITERIQQKQFLIQQGKLAEMGDMVAAIAHQWNEPLVELSAQVQDLQTAAMLDELKEINMEEFVNDSMVQIKYMSKTLTDFRNFLKPSTKKKLFSINKSFEEIFEIIGKQIFYSNINLKYNYDLEGEELLIYGYENEFKQVLLNLINNAKNKIIEKKSNDKFNLIINIKNSPTYVIIEIIDDGGSISDEIIDKIFEPYFTTKQDGTGFGLYMAKVIIEDKMAGIISAQNKENNVIFTLKLPHIKE